MAIETGKTYLHLTSGLPCTITEVSRVSGRAMGTLSDGRTVHDIVEHELQDLPAPAPAPAPVPEAVATGPEEEDEDEEDEDIKSPGLMTPRQFGRRMRGDRP